MKHEILIDLRTGTVSLQGLPVTLRVGESRKMLASLLSAFFRSNLDHGNGIEWLFFEGLSFAGKPAFMSVCFHQGRLSELSWNIDFRKSPADKSWPSTEECDQELAVVRGALRKMLSRPFSTDEERFPWGSVWSYFDIRGGFPSSGLRYGTVD